MFVYNDGGRGNSGFKGMAGDCLCRSIAIATDLPYTAVYELINAFAAQERKSRKRTRKSSARNGVYRPTAHKIMRHLGFVWMPCMWIGSGCKVHLRADELPSGRLVIALSKHFTAMVDGVVHDTYDPSREGTRCVYGYWTRDMNLMDKAEEKL